MCVVNGTFATAPDFKRRHAQEVLTSTFVAAHPAVSEVFVFSKTETLFKILRAVLAVNALLCNPIQFAIEHAVCTLHVRLVLRCQFLNLLLVLRLKFAGIACALGVHQTFMFSSFALIRFFSCQAVPVLVLLSSSLASQFQKLTYLFWPHCVSFCLPQTESNTFV